MRYFYHLIRITIPVMLKRIERSLRSLIPTIKKQDEGFALEAKSIPERIFYYVVDGLRSSLDNEIDRKRGIFFDQFLVDSVIFFWGFLTVSYIFYYLPMEFFSDDPSKKLLLGQLFVIVLLTSLLWTGYVYIIQSFKNLTREKFIPVIEGNHQLHFNYQKEFHQLFAGLRRLEWNSGLGLNIYLRSFLIGVPLLGWIIYSMRTQLSDFFFGIFFSHSLDALLSLYLSIVAVSIVAIPVFLVFLTIFTVPIILIYLLIAVRFLPLAINSFQEMGGTELFGKIVINCIFLVSFAIGIVPVFSVIGKLDLSSFHIPIPEGTLGNVTELIREEVVSSVKTIPVESLSKYAGYFELFFIFIGLALLVIFALHYRIKRNKLEVLLNLERAISIIDFTHPGDKENNLYYLSLHEKVSSTNEWPIKKIFAVELIISILPLFVSLLFP